MGDACDYDQQRVDALEAFYTFDEPSRVWSVLGGNNNAWEQHGGALWTAGGGGPIAVAIGEVGTLPMVAEIGFTVVALPATGFAAVDVFALGSIASSQPLQLVDGYCRMKQVDGGAPVLEAVSGVTSVGVGSFLDSFGTTTRYRLVAEREGSTLTCRVFANELATKDIETTNIAADESGRVSVQAINAEVRIDYVVVYRSVP